MVKQIVYISLISLFYFSCTPRKKKNKREFYGECSSNVHCKKNEICKKNKCIPTPPPLKSKNIKPPTGMVYIPYGPFILGSNTGTVLEKPQVESFTTGYFIDKFEVSVDEFNKCIKSGNCLKAKCKQKSGNLPITCVNWKNAYNYCKFMKKRLPTEEEWEKSARGNDARRYPWGDATPDCSMAQYRKCKPLQLAEVKSKFKGKSPFGTVNQAGNVWEWTKTKTPVWDIGNDPKGKRAGYRSYKKKLKINKGKEYYIIRGGSYIDDPDAIRTSIKQLLPIDFYSKTLGFRCAKNL